VLDPDAQVIKSECPDKVVLLGERHLRLAIVGGRPIPSPAVVPSTPGASARGMDVDGRVTAFCFGSGNENKGKGGREGHRGRVVRARLSRRLG